MPLSSGNLADLKIKLTTLKQADPASYSALAIQLSLMEKKPCYTAKQRKLIFATLVEVDKAKRAGRQILTNPNTVIPAEAENLPQDPRQFPVSFKPLLERLWSKAGTVSGVMGIFSLSKYPLLARFSWFCNLFGLAHDYLPDAIKDKIITVTDWALAALVLEDSLSDPLSGCFGGLAEIPSFPQLPDISPDALLLLLQKDEQLLLVLEEAYQHGDSKDCVRAICDGANRLYTAANAGNFFNSIDHGVRKQAIEVSEQAPGATRFPAAS